MNPETRLKLRAARAGRGFTQADLAEMTGVTRQTIGLIESGRYNPTLNLCIAIAQALGTTLDDLFWENSHDT